MKLPKAYILESNTVIQYNESFFETYDAENDAKFTKKEEEQSLVFHHFLQNSAKLYKVFCL